MERVLTVKEATVQTVQVEIQTLKVGKKQVTMGLFRQLPYRPLIDPQTLQLRGLPWGHVNYWWDGDGSRYTNEAKLHIVWQHGDTLHRSIEYRTIENAWTRELRKDVQRALTNWFLVAVRGAQRCEFRNNHSIEDKYNVVLDGRSMVVILTPEEREQIRKLGVYRQANTGALSRYDTFLEEHGLSQAPLEELSLNLQITTKELDAYTQQWAKQWQTLCQLPQLFIAV